MGAEPGPDLAYVGVDLGATRVRAIVGDGSGAVLGRRRRATPAGAEGPTVAQCVLEAVADACEDAGVEPADVAAAGIGTIGPLAPAEGAVVDPVNLPAVDRIDLVEPVAGLLDADVRFHNDATAGAIGERFAAPGDPANLVYLTLSTGVGAGAIVDGRALLGRAGNAVEVGHATFDPDAPVTCGCGSPGHWEAFCGGANLPDHAAVLARETGLGTDLDPPACTPADLLSAAGSDPLATHLVERMGAWNAVGVAMLVHAYAPETIYVGGAIARNHPEAVLEPIRSRLPDLCLVDRPPVRPTTLGDEAVVRGALASAITGGTGAGPRYT